MKNLIEYIFENAGHEFEKRYVEKFDEKYKADLETFLGTSIKSTKNDIKEEGKKNKSRPLIWNGNTLSIGQPLEKVGETLVDIYLEPDNLNLSLKYGKTVTFLNCGISKAFPKSCFDKYANKKDKNFIPGQNGLEILNFFGIDPNQFAEVFISYKGTKKSGGRHSDNGKDKINEGKFLEFIRSIVGYGYIIVHEIGNTIKYTDLRTIDDMNTFVGNNINDIKVYYPKGGSKTVSVEVELDNIICVFQFRNKSGGVYPTTMTVSFKEKR